MGHTLPFLHPTSVALKGDVMGTYLFRIHGRLSSGQAHEQTKVERVSKLIPLVRFLDSATAHILCGRLNAEGIFAVVTDDFGWNLGLSPNALGGATVKVTEDDLDKALEIKRACEAE